LPRVVRGAEIGGAILRRWPHGTRALADLPIDHAVAPVAYRGGARAAAAALDAFVDGGGLDRYAELRNQTGSGLSPWLHFGHLAAHEVIARVWDHAGWDPS